jgi:hypothetical protein
LIGYAVFDGRESNRHVIENQTGYPLHIWNESQGEEPETVLAADGSSIPPDSMIRKTTEKHNTLLQIQFQFNSMVQHWKV